MGQTRTFEPLRCLDRTDLPHGSSPLPRLDTAEGRMPNRCSHVMVVEDDQDTREVVKVLLELDGNGVTEAVDGFEALDRIRTLRRQNPKQPCVVVLDLMMPRCSGLEFRRHQLSDPAIADIPVIVLSAVADQLALDDLQPFARVAKPFDPEQLLEVVRRACVQSRDMPGSSVPDTTE